MANHLPLSTQNHRELRVRTDRAEALGDGVMCCITFPEEFRQLQNTYPIVFQRSQDREGFAALALFGFQQDENLFLGEDGWGASYLPLAMQIQPFLVGRPSGPDGAPQLHVDLDSPRIAEAGDGVRVLDDDGRPTEFLESINDKLGILHAGYTGSTGFFDALEKYELLEPFAVDVELKDGSKNRLVGFHAIQEDRLRELDASAVAELHAAGHLMPIFMAVASMSNFAGLIARKNALLADG